MNLSDQPASSASNDPAASDSDAQHGTPYVLDVDSNSFEQDVLNRSFETPVVVDFWAPWCGPCRMLGPMLEAAAAKANGRFYLAKINTDDNQGLSEQYGVRGIPAVFAIHKGKVYKQFTGVLPEPQLDDWLSRLEPSEADKMFEEAKTLVAEDPGAAEEKLRQVLEMDPVAHQAKLTLAQLLFGTGHVAAAKELLDELKAKAIRDPDMVALDGLIALAEKADEAGSEEECRAAVEKNSDDLQAHINLGYVLAANDKTEEALQTLLHVAENDRDELRDAAKDAMVAIFAVLGMHHEMTTSYRRQLAAALY